MTEIRTYTPFALDKLSTEQLDEISVIDIYSSLLVEDPANIPEIVKSLSKEKLAAVVDISSWDKDTFNLVNYLTWLNVILSMQPYDALKELKKMDQPELIMFLAGIVDLQWKDPEDVHAGNPFVSPDGVFLIYPKEGQSESEMFNTAVALINLAYLEDTAYGRSLCMDAMDAMYSGLEEECFRFKNARLADEGVPTYLEALELYHYEDPTKLLSKILKMVGQDNLKKHEPSKTYILSQYSVVPRHEWNSIFNLSTELADSVKIELGALLTASIVLNNAIDMNPATMTDTAKRSICYFRIGFELIMENAKFSAEELIKYVELKQIFRLGFSLLVDLRKNANNIKSAIDTLNRPDIINSDEKEFIRNVVLPIPMFQTSLETKAASFETLDQLKKARRILSDIADRILKLTIV